MQGVVGVFSLKITQVAELTDNLRSDEVLECELP